MKKRARWFLIVVAIVVALSAVLFWLWRCPIKYEMILLPTEIRYIRDINDSGKIVGAGIGAKINHAFSWSEKDGLKDLGTFGFKQATAICINNAGQILISATNPNEKTQGLLLDPAKGVSDPNAGATNLGSLGGTETFPAAMNEHGHVVGMSYTSVGGRRAFYWDRDSGMVSLGILGGSPTGRYGSVACDINDSGQVVGGSGLGVNLLGHAFIWTADTGMVDLTPSYAFTTNTKSINSKGKIFGTMNDGSRSYSWCFWDANTAAQTGTSNPANGILLEVNDFGQILGYFEQPRPFDKPVKRYFLEDPEKGRIYLDRFLKPKGWRILNAVMNKQGWIAGTIEEKDGFQRRSVILKPVKE